ncbi:hypothetical protein BT63DRAFT_460571 [Microthyrium microscopicum]|uniref:Uncharacterized protein n=1 Tax=Microthyrium microscopicum TaxID=703497 RepID=A0A6A6TXV1_9PEZI|nr:hypothetical protein BT63DRAFT_460571 [Microthyrium microscopicum]
MATRDPAVRYPKRMRSAISYTETDDLSESEVAYESKDDVDFEAPVKKQKKASNVRKAHALADDKLTDEQKRQRAIFPFLRLPGEIRNEIYQWCLCVDGGQPIKIHSPPIKYPGRVSYITAKQKALVSEQSGHSNKTESRPKYLLVPHLMPRILLLNLQINQEATPFLYQNRFIFSTTRALHAFLVKVGKNNCNHLRNIAICRLSRKDRVSRYDIFMTLQQLTTCTNVQSIDMDPFLESLEWNRFNVTLNGNLSDGSVEVELKAFAEHFWAATSHWFRAVALAKRNIFAGLQILVFADDSLERTLQRARGVKYSWWYPGSGYQGQLLKRLVACTKQAFDTEMRSLIKSDFSGYEVDPQGNMLINLPNRFR